MIFLEVSLVAFSDMISQCHTAMAKLSSKSIALLTPVCVCQLLGGGTHVSCSQLDFLYREMSCLDHMGVSTYLLNESVLQPCSSTMTGDGVGKGC